jgi:hypothetical protein
VREVVKHACVEEVILCDIDEACHVLRMGMLAPKKGSVLPSGAKAFVDVIVVQWPHQFLRRWLSTSRRNTCRTCLQLSAIPKLQVWRLGNFSDPPLHPPNPPSLL